MHHIVLRAHRSPCEGHLAFMPDLFQEQGDKLCLKYALLSVSYLRLSNETSSPELYMKARKSHGLSLEHLNKALCSRENAMKDEVLATCLLLSMFYVRLSDGFSSSVADAHVQNLSHEGGGLPDPHMSGISHLLQLRSNEQDTGKYTRSLIGSTIVQIVST